MQAINIFLHASLDTIQNFLHGCLNIGESVVLAWGEQWVAHPVLTSIWSTPVLLFLFVALAAGVMFCLKQIRLLGISILSLVHSASNGLIQIMSNLRLLFKNSYNYILYGNRVVKYYPYSEDKRQIYFLKKGKKNGPETFYYHSGKINKKQFWKNGQLEGKCTIFYPNQKLCETYYCVNGQKQKDSAHYGKMPLVHRNPNNVQYSSWEFLNSKEYVLYQEALHNLKQQMKNLLPKEGNIFTKTFSRMEKALTGQYITLAKSMQIRCEMLQNAAQLVEKEITKELERAFSLLTEETTDLLHGPLGLFFGAVRDIGYENKEISYEIGGELKTIQTLSRNLQTAMEDAGNFPEHPFFRDFLSLIWPTISTIWSIIEGEEILTNMSKTINQIFQQTAEMEKDWQQKVAVLKQLEEMYYLTSEWGWQCKECMEKLLPYIPDFKANDEEYIKKLNDAASLMQALVQQIQLDAEWSKKGELSAANIKILNRSRQLIRQKELIKYE